MTVEPMLPIISLRRAGAGSSDAQRPTSRSSTPGTSDNHARCAVVRPLPSTTCTARGNVEETAASSADSGSGDAFGAPPSGFAWGGLY